MDLNEYLDSLGLPDADRTQLATILGKAGDKATAPLLMRSDYSKKTAELASERARLAGESAAVNNQLTKALRDLETNRLTAAQYRTRLERIQDEYGVDVTDILTAKPPVPDPTVTPAIDPALLSRLEQAERNFNINPLIAARISDAREMYGELFGTTKGFKAEKLLEYAREKQIPLMADPETGGRGALEELYKFGDRREAMLRETITADVTRQQEEKFNQRVSELTLGSRTGERAPFVQSGSAVLNERFKNVVAERTGEKPAAGDPPQQHQPRSEAEKIRTGGAARFEKAFNERRMNGVALGAPDKKAAA